MILSTAYIEQVTHFLKNGFSSEEGVHQKSNLSKRGDMEINIRNTNTASTKNVDRFGLIPTRICNKSLKFCIIFSAF